MKEAPTLIDQLYRATFKARERTFENWKSPTDMRAALEGAKRFMVKDDRMAAFMADLANEAFQPSARNVKLNCRLADSLRVQARLPHDSIWVEYPLRAYQRRANEIRGLQAIPDDQVPKTEGWLIQQHPKLDTAIILHLFNNSDIADKNGFDTWTFPFAYGWTCDDSPLPWHWMVQPREELQGALSEISVGILGYKRDNVSIVSSPLLEDPQPNFGRAYVDLLYEWQGVVRRVWALLATIDHLPLSYGSVRQSKGFLAKGRIRKFLDHHTITLNIPAKKDTRVLARQMIAIARRKRHEVRAHWRDDWRNPPSKRCMPHIWEAVDDEADIIQCSLCQGRQFHIHKHERGDASLGYVTHDYVLKHEKENADG